MWQMWQMFDTCDRFWHCWSIVGFSYTLLQIYTLSYRMGPLHIDSRLSRTQSMRFTSGGYQNQLSPRLPQTSVHRLPADRLPEYGFQHNCSLLKSDRLKYPTQSTVIRLTCLFFPHNFSTQAPLNIINEKVQNPKNLWGQNYCREFNLYHRCQLLRNSAAI